MLEARKPLDVYPIVEPVGRTVFRLVCDLRDAPEIVEPIRPGFVYGSYRLTQSFREWLFQHREFLIEIMIGQVNLTIRFPDEKSAIAFKMCWV